MKRFQIVYMILICILLIAVAYTWDGMMHVLKLYQGPSPIDPGYRKYSVLKGNFQFSLPVGWTLNEQTFSGGEIEYHGDFASTDKRIKGMVQIWNINVPLKSFLENSRRSAVGNVDFKFYRVEPAKIGSYDGYLVEYSRRGNDTKYYRSEEYFIPAYGTRFFRMSFFTSEEYYSPKLKALYNNIAATVNIKNK